MAAMADSSTRDCAGQHFWFAESRRSPLATRMRGSGILHILACREGLAAQALSAHSRFGFMGYQTGGWLAPRFLQRYGPAALFQKGFCATAGPLPVRQARALRQTPASESP